MFKKKCIATKVLKYFYTFEIITINDSATFKTRNFLSLAAGVFAHIKQIIGFFSFEFLWNH